MPLSDSQAGEEVAEEEDALLGAGEADAVQQRGQQRLSDEGASAGRLQDLRRQARRQSDGRRRQRQTRLMTVPEESEALDDSVRGVRGVR